MMRPSDTWQLDPTHPSRWPEQQTRGRVAFQIRYGLLALGIPVAVLVDLLLIVVRHDFPIFFSAHHVLQLAYLMAVIAPLGGLLLGRLLWQIGERRLGDRLLTEEFLDPHGEP
jgi:hypothetical protein